MLDVRKQTALSDAVAPQLAGHDHPRQAQGDAVLFLASSEASFVAGAELFVDGVTAQV